MLPGFLRQTILSLLVIGAGHSQTEKAFDVTSVKPSHSANGWFNVTSFKNGHFLAVNVSLRELLTLAYQLPAVRISGGPAWARSDRYDVEGKAEAPPPDKDMTIMLQSLLADRFQLKVRREGRMSSVYALVTDKNGVKFTAVEHRDCPAGCTGVRFEGRGFTAQYVSMPVLAIALTGMMGTQVLDETGLTGRYDFKLEWLPDPADAASPDRPPSAVRAGAGMAVDLMFGALPQQLGLRLESRKAQLEWLVIDSASRPSEN